MLHTVKPGETLYSISEDYRTPLPSIIGANPSIDPNMIIVGQKIKIPGFPLVESQAYSIDVNITEKNLTLKHVDVVQKIYPVAVGRMLHETPIGDYIIINKAPNPGGPYGTMWMSLSKKHYGIHGTNDPSSIGKNVSKGCIRMYNHDVEELSRIIPIGTPVYIRT
ncbi:L,D-transpeptidase family protein [Evansella sp. AB-P1]|uniref:L,D-transpeptidase family protein n=1 Tax=Evansella sp. AB-P1 TaxID=3037653 RepID=UPI00241FF479|nr:L,D-transpeptidase family protein [Evansella sp. AB-P1]MDG5788403.1 L,D-transpeptidase family protein [Evansella sp. AB-P1]